MNYEDRVTKEYIENALAGAGPKIAYGSYTGTGTYGSATPTTLTFDFVPKFVVVLPEIAVTYCYARILLINGVKKAHTSHQDRMDSEQLIDVAWSGNSVSWYSTASDGQFNVKDKLYYYFAIG